MLMEVVGMSEAVVAPRWMTTAEVAARLRISPVTLRWWARTGRGPQGAKKSGRKLLWPENCVEDYEANLPEPALQGRM